MLKPLSIFFKRHGMAIALLFLLATVKAWYSWDIGLEYKWTGDTSDTFLRIVTETRNNGIVSDGRPLIAQIIGNQAAVIANQPITRWYQAAFDNYLETVYVATGDITLTYKLLIFPLNLIFLLGAYFLFSRMGLSIRSAIGLAVISSFHFSISWAGEKMGLGPVWTYSRRHIFTAFLPWIICGLLLASRRFTLTVVLFAIAGLLANLHASGLVLLEILALTWFLSAQPSPKRLAQMLILLAIGTTTAFYALGSIWGRALESISLLLLGWVSPSALANTFFPVLEAAKQAIPDELQYLSYPPREYDRLPRTLVDLWFAATLIATLSPLLARRFSPRHANFSLVLAVVAAMTFVSFKEFGALGFLGGLLFLSRHTDDNQQFAFSLASLLILVCFWVSVLGGMAFQVAHIKISGFPLVFDQFRGMRFLGFLVFFWLASILALPKQFSIPHWHKPATIVALLILCAGLSRDFYREHIRYRHSPDFAKRKALLDLASWAKMNTPADALFLVGSSGFGIRADRLVTHTDKTAQWPNEPKLAPRYSITAEEALMHALRLGATHIVLPAATGHQVKPCVLSENSKFLIANTPCMLALPPNNGDQ